MKILDPSNYEFIKFEKSKVKNKKYNAVLFNKKWGREKRVPFGDVRYQHYKDSTGLNLYSDLDHNDIRRRDRYLKRHYKDKDNEFSSGYWSAKYLW